MQTNDFDRITKLVNDFRDERDWRQFHNEKDLALSVSLEASELLEKFQWKTSEEAIRTDLEGVKDEAADVFIYLFMLCSNLGVSPEEIIQEKLNKQKLKYPVEKSRGQKKKYTEF